jgi:hypothetical protein
VLRLLRRLVSRAVPVSAGPGGHLLLVLVLLVLPLLLVCAVAVSAAACVRGWLIDRVKRLRAAEAAAAEARCVRRRAWAG